MVEQSIWHSYHCCGRFAYSEPADAHVHVCTHTQSHTNTHTHTHTHTHAHTHTHTLILTHSLTHSLTLNSPLLLLCNSSTTIYDIGILVRMYACILYSFSVMTNTIRLSEGHRTKHLPSLSTKVREIKLLQVWL